MPLPPVAVIAAPIVEKLIEEALKELLPAIIPELEKIIGSKDHRDRVSRNMNAAALASKIRIAGKPQIRAAAERAGVKITEDY